MSGTFMRTAKIWEHAFKIKALYVRDFNSDRWEKANLCGLVK